MTVLSHTPSDASFANAVMGTTIARMCSLLALPLGVTLAGCCPPCPAIPAAVKPEPTAAEIESFEVSREALLARGATSSLIAELESSPFKYFRLLADAYEHRVCEAFADEQDGLPVVTVHGDAHVEQFVVTTAGYGLEDFDRAGFGPAVVDLVRYASSLHVACEAASFACSGDAAVDRFLAAFGDSLVAAPSPGPPPAVVDALRSQSPADHGTWLAWADSTMGDLDSASRAKLQLSWTHFIATMADVLPEQPPASFEIVKAGTLSMGIGSALEQKLLIRLAGPTPAPEDDLIVEAREGSPPSELSCVWRPSYGESMILVFTAILGRRMPEVHGFVPLFGSSKRYWVQDWDAGYRALSLEHIPNQAALEELAVDAAHQLGGHLWREFPGKVRAYALHAQREAFGLTRPRIETLARAYAAESIDAWRRFRADAP